MTNKTASMKLAQVVAMATTPQTMHKQADFRQVVENIKNHFRRNSGVYTGMATGSGIGALYNVLAGRKGKMLQDVLSNGVFGAAVGYGFDRFDDLKDKNRELSNTVNNLEQDNDMLRNALADGLEGKAGDSSNTDNLVNTPGWTVLP